MPRYSILNNPTFYAGIRITFSIHASGGFGPHGGGIKLCQRVLLLVIVIVIIIGLLRSGHAGLLDERRLAGWRMGAILLMLVIRWAPFPSHILLEKKCAAGSLDIKSVDTLLQGSNFGL